MPLGVVFAGPSLPPPRDQHPDLEYRLPAARGDLLGAVRDGASIIGLIDGVFHQSLAVSPAEVREAAHAGVRLYGGASMGALRACECPQAMQGIGVIWAAFASGELRDDDEVAVTFSPVDFQLIAYPLIQIRAAARIASSRYPNAQVALSMFVEAVHHRPFQERTLEVLRHLFVPLEGEGVPWQEMLNWLTARQFDVKYRDALAVVSAVAVHLG